MRATYVLLTALAACAFTAGGPALAQTTGTAVTPQTNGAGTPPGTTRPSMPSQTTQPTTSPQSMPSNTGTSGTYSHGQHKHVMKKKPRGTKNVNEGNGGYPASGSSR